MQDLLEVWQALWGVKVRFALRFKGSGHACHRLTIMIGLSFNWSKSHISVGSVKDSTCNGTRRMWIVDIVVDARNLVGNAGVG